MVEGASEEETGEEEKRISESLRQGSIAVGDVGKPEASVRSYWRTDGCAGCDRQRGCTSGSRLKADTSAASRFGAFPLYWVGPRFEKWDLATIQGLDRASEFVSFIYGTCTPRGGEQPSCTPPFEIQMFPLCWHLDVVASAPVWNRRRIRGAPVGRNPDGAPVLLTRRIQVKVYRREGSDAGLPLRVLHALRSINHVPPVINPEDAIPAPRPGVLEGVRRCRR